MLLAGHGVFVAQRPLAAEMAIPDQLLHQLVPGLLLKPLVPWRVALFSTPGAHGEDGQQRQDEKQGEEGNGFLPQRHSAGGDAENICANAIFFSHTITHKKEMAGGGRKIFPVFVAAS